MTNKLLTALGIGMIAMLFLVSCENNAGGNATSMQFKRMDIAGAKALALASESTSQQNAPARIKAEDGEDPTYNVSHPIYTVSEDGTLVEVHYTIEVVGNGEIVDMIKANMRLKASYIYAIGDQWLWLVNCEYDYPGIEDVQEPLRGKIRELMHSGFESNFLVRRSDGALFEWTREQGRPQRGRGYWRPSDVYGEVESVGKDIFTSPCMGGVDDYYGSIYKLEDQGDILNVKRVLNTTQFGGFLLPDKRGFIGTYLFYGRESGGFDGGDLTVTLDPATLTLSNISTGDAQLEAKGFVNIDGTNYLLGITNMWSPNTKFYLYELENQMGMWKAKTPALMEWAPAWEGDWSAIPSVKRPYKSAVATWWGGGSIYTLDPIAKTITKKALPEHYPSSENSYYDGIAYVLAENQDGFYVCDLSKDAAEYVEFVYDESIVPYVNQIAMFLGYGGYDPSTGCFSGAAQLLDGTYIVLIVEAQGENRGKVRVLHEGESDAGQVISVMVRLN